MSADPILHFAPQTCARVSLTALEEVGLPFETRLVAFLAGEHRSEAYLAINASGKVPVLQTRDGVITQTGAILSYLAETHPQARLLPQADGPFARSAAVAWLFRYSADLHPLVTRFVMPRFMSTCAEDAQGIRATARVALGQQLAPIQARLAKADWLLGEGWSILDAYLAWIWFRITGAGFESAAFPALHAHHERASQRPSAQAALAREAEAQAQLEARGLLFKPPVFAKD